MSAVVSAIMLVLNAGLAVVYAHLPFIMARDAAGVIRNAYSAPNCGLLWLIQRAFNLDLGIPSS
jgi:hypothetical protein